MNLNLGGWCRGCGCWSGLRKRSLRWTCRLGHNAAVGLATCAAPSVGGHARLNPQLRWGERSDGRADRGSVEIYGRCLASFLLELHVAQRGLALDAGLAFGSAKLKVSHRGRFPSAGAGTRMPLRLPCHNGIPMGYQWETNGIPNGIPNGKLKTVRFYSKS